MPAPHKYCSSYFNNGHIFEHNTAGKDIRIQGTAIRKIYKINWIFYVTTQLASNLAMSKLATGAETNFVTLYCIATKMFHGLYFNQYSINIFVIIRIIYFNKQHYIS